MAVCVMLIISLMLLSVHLGLGHNWLVKPMAFNTNWKTVSCEGSECTAACPKVLQPDKMNNMMEKPAATWRRGDTVRICYSRNNHRGGFARFSLVPVNVMNSREWHSKLTLFHTCFDGGAESCRSEGVPCGTSRDTTHCRNVRIPTVFPDGDYVLGHVWYGGLHYKQTHGQFPDYYSCSFVRIQGGYTKCVDYKPFFNPGSVKRGSSMEKSIRNGMCHSASMTIGECGMKGCWDMPAKWGVPSMFQRNRNVEAVTCDLVNTAKKEQSEEKHVLAGICKNDVCCHEMCGKCGGRGCNNRPGGGENCCNGAIKRNRGRTCEKFPPPCIRSV